MRSLRVALASLAALASLVCAHDVSAQLCIGSTSYVVRDTAGRVMTAEQVRELRVLEINGLQPRLREGAPDEPPYYEYDFPTWYAGKDTVKTERVLRLTNPMTLGSLDQRQSFCGRVEEVTLAYAGKVMRMLFDIRQHNTAYQIDSPRFQDGTFHLGGRACAGNVAPPLIDNRTTGMCVVSATNWEGMDREWVRYLINETAGGGFVRLSPEACRARGNVVINTPAELAALWADHPELRHDGPGSRIDFTRNFVLAIHQAERSGYSFEAFRVDKRGDLTFVPLAHDREIFGACSVLILPLSRSAVTSVAGKPVPAPPR